MSMDRETIHLALAVYTSPYPTMQIRLMARRYLRKTKYIPRKRIYRALLDDPNPVKTVKEVYDLRFNSPIIKG